MSMYNVMHGVHPLAGPLMHLLGIHPREFGRLRDCYLGRSESGELEIHVFTRNGGGNREHTGECPPSETCGCDGCVMKYNVKNMPGYIRDFDDDFDGTYATIVFQIPDGMRPSLVALAESDPSAVPPCHRERFEAFMRKMNDHPDDPAVVRARESIRPLLDKILSRV